MAEPSVAVNTPAMIPPMTTTIRDRAGMAFKVAIPSCFQSNFPGVPAYPFLRAMITATTTQQMAQRIPGMYPARNRAATEVPPETSE